MENPSAVLGLQPCATVSPSHITAGEVPSHDLEEMWNLTGSLNARDGIQEESWYKKIGRLITQKIGRMVTGRWVTWRVSSTAGESQAQLRG